jgi:hypothetical protein
VKDSWTEPQHPHQNPAETRAIRFLKRVSKALITVTGAPRETWLYAIKYVALINNWTSHESLHWKTPYEVRYGIQPDISPLLAFHFYQPVYYYTEEGNYDSGEKLGYILGVSENVGAHMTFQLLTDDTQEVITRSVLRSIDDPLPNKTIIPSEALDPKLRIMDIEKEAGDAIEAASDTSASGETIEDSNEATDLFVDTNEKPIPKYRMKKGKI